MEAKGCGAGAGPLGFGRIGVDVPYNVEDPRVAFGLFVEQQAIAPVGADTPDWIHSTVFGILLRGIEPVDSVASPNGCSPTCVAYDQ